MSESQTRADLIAVLMALSLRTQGTWDQPIGSHWMAATSLQMLIKQYYQIELGFDDILDVIKDLRKVGAAEIDRTGSNFSLNWDRLHSVLVWPMERLLPSLDGSNDFEYSEIARFQKKFERLRQTVVNHYFPESSVFEEIRQEFAPARERDRPIVPMFVPAADRIVIISHNSPEWIEIREKLNQIEEAIRKDNSPTLSDPAEKERIREQIKAGSRLLSIRNVSLAALGGTLIVALRYLLEKIGDEAIGKLAEWIISAVQTLIGLL